MKIAITITFLCLVNISFGQVSGNINYQNQVRYPDMNIDVNFPNDTDLYVSAKGLANVKADAYVAIFSVTQMGKTTEEVNRLIDERIKQATQSIAKETGVETYVDMVSFVPFYAYDVQKKIFSKKTYNEVPAGFELKKNIHIKYTNPNTLNQIISALSGVEIYDLVRVDYFAENIEAVKQELMDKAKAALKRKLNNHKDILQVEFDSMEKQLVDGYKVVLPVEMYKSYQAYSSSSLNLKKSANINQASKSTTLYYQPIIDKEFDFVINPVIHEPVIQVMYEIKLKLNTKKLIQKTDNKEFMLITPNGDIKQLNLNQ